MAVTLLSLALLASSALSTPINAPRQAAPAVTIQNGTVVGTTAGNVDSFRGIPFAKPPVGNLRLKPPQSITQGFGTLAATGPSASCPQFFVQTYDTSNLPASAIALLADSPLFQVASNQKEDCLTMTVQRPTGTKAGDNLPVLFWIFGGGFEVGSNNMYDGSPIIRRSVQMGKPIIYVSVNYRVGGFGFLAGKELGKEGSTNLGLRDQRLGLQWNAENIRAFGGDPDKVTIWGESAGAISVFDQLLVNGGDNTYKGKPLFRGAIMDSGSVIPVDSVSASQAQAVFDTVAKNAGCGGASDKLACLRSKDYTTFLNAANSVPGIFSYRSLDLSYLPRPDPSDNFFPQSPEVPLKAGAYAKVPVIIGDQEDEGTLFSLVQSNITTTQQLIDYLSTYFPNRPDAQTLTTQLVSLYPEDPAAGSPFRTGQLNNVYPQYKRLAAILGDFAFTLTRRNTLNVIAKTVPSWSYLSSYFYGTPVIGTVHGSDLLPAYSLGGGLSIPSQTIQSYYISFVNNLDPNALGTAAPLINWPRYNPSSPQLLNLLALTNTLIPDTFRLAASNFLAANQEATRVKE
ncbi:alpha/beta-hydrolase [Polychaeton citri CBS 116435]|uniref:Carboxylic ester hydrolase n=1 Tax=Polychaeton citri CBS 116435 TaxID=1314669 RepID=A0A9P4QEB1_9PEZI|nr:alpha/beta-hydrolase [Polychaeton citri CBS 116435]